MIFKKRSNSMLQYAKTKAKLEEFSIDKEDYPKFPINSNELSFPTVYVLSKYSESLLTENLEETNALYSELEFVSQYFDAVLNSKDRTDYNIDFLLSGAASYFLSDDFGSAKVLIAQINNSRLSHSISRLLVMLLKHILLQATISTDVLEVKESKAFASAIKHYFANGDRQEEIIEVLDSLRDTVYIGNNISDIYYFDILYAITKKIIDDSAWKLLPLYSELEANIWKEYLSAYKSISILWPAQKIIGEYGVLAGQNAIVQLPTGVGKTKSIELIIRSTFLSNRANVVVIIAPLRALCNEISHDLHFVFDKTITINQFSDVLQDDFRFDIENNKKYIIICTPEKLNYLMHHNEEILLSVGLFIFDEAHMFDDFGRGAIYELLVSEIKKYIKYEVQLVLLSAVLSNADQISEWMFGDNGVVANSSSIKTTLKSIGFISSDTNLYYYNNTKMENFDFFVHKSIVVEPLKLLGKETKAREFPNNNSNDVAIYYAIRQCNNGGVAIYVNRTDSVKTIIKRVIEIEKRGYNVQNLLENSEESEIHKLYNIISLHYGKDYVYSCGALLGVFPHYSDVANGVRLSIEHALRNKKIRFIVCTSTLAQGVNVPIKYLLITNFKVSKNSMQIRNFQNLIGRTARSGIYTEGSIIVTDTKFHDNRHLFKGGGVYRWNECAEMFDPTNSEACGSSILSVVKKLVVDYNTAYNGAKIAEFIIENYCEESCFTNLANRLVTAYFKKKGDNTNNDIFAMIMGRKAILENIENYLCYAFSLKEQVDYIEYSSELCRETLAYALANENEKLLLLKLFNCICNKILLSGELEDLEFYSKVMLGVDSAKAIAKWLDANYPLLALSNENELLKEIVGLFFSLNNNFLVSRQDAAIIANMWIESKSYYEIYNKLQDLKLYYKIKKIEKVCSNISYHLSFIVGNILDLVKEKYEDLEMVDTLTLLQKKLKYGVKTHTEVTICENIFDDRIIAKGIRKIIQNTEITDDIKEYLKFSREDITLYLDNFPSYFINRFTSFIKS